ncbi:MULTISPECIES: hypothetical protein [Micromonospora]|uniref:Cytidylate kinase n=1 Tax=Micromonospora solifontis TaxID=2487138 RepID=A0ABX9WGT5_9ACTN|nr:MULTISPECIES: hypothetical protein [Micromonospora]NES14164.1 hypothetical protein [Micromonospora sp. PPF5-17B]NES37988.1 hypothetical protein [Micromonospora solifontis]NES55887.1 hypothetical protein [Micromonospora sp. PPF5-6]RNL97744.1 hypothetical protein EFE23_17785 [Micromonospora solifontis]
MNFDPLTTARRALWIGGAQWAGKTTLAVTLALRYGLTAYLYDRHDARGHDDRRVADRVRRGEPPGGPDAEATWVATDPDRMAAETLAGFPRRFEWVLDDLSALVTARRVIVEGWGLRPELVAPLVGSTRQMVVLVPTPEFRAYQMGRLARATARHPGVSDPQRAWRNRIARDELVAADAVAHARELGIRVIEVDGSRDAEAVAGLVAEHFAAYL